jgi:hypothetical protein
MQNPIDSIVNWQFLDEPAYRWAIFAVGSCFFLGAWRGVLDLMK